MPEQEDLDKMSMLIAGVPFDKLQYPEHRATVMKLAIQADIASDTRDIAIAVDSIKDTLGALAETAEAVGKDISSIEEEMRDVGKWFRLSKLWEGV